jgi:predicted HD superfamily hydrolase involved in NAD metabolism
LAKTITKGDCMDYQRIIDALSQKLSPKRWNHCRGVEETAIRMARRYGVDTGKAMQAGLLHDCAREIPVDVLLALAKRHHIDIDDIERNEPVLLHAPVGAVLAERDYGITDQEVLAAIRSHTVGGKGMNVLAKIIFLADFIEPGRVFSGVDRLRQLADTDLDHALIAAYDHTILYIVERGNILHPATVEGRNELIRKNLKVSV